MRSSNHRVIATTGPDDEITYRILGVTETAATGLSLDSHTSAPPCGDSLQDLRQDLALMRAAFFRPVLHLGPDGTSLTAGNEVPESTSIDDYHRHEALDRAAVFAEHFETHVASHPVILKDPALRAQAEEITNRLAALYQAIGRLDTR